MELIPFKVEGTCVRPDDDLFENIRLCQLRNLPEIAEAVPAHTVPCAIVGSAPSVRTQINKLRELKSMGVPIVAIRDAHDWLISNGVVPDYALSVDPLATAANCFKSPHPEVHYLIASQSDPAMFDFLKDAKVTVWHCYMKEGQKLPKGKMLIGGATTSGLRGIVVFYVLGFREFLLFGLDSCLSGDELRLNGTRPKPEDQIVDVKLEPHGQVFRCNTAMALQAQAFQDVYEQLSDATFEGFGHGLIQAIIEKRRRNDIELDVLEKQPDNGRVSFIHKGGPEMASFRYRAQIPAGQLGASINDPTASTLIFGKPIPQELIEIARAKTRGQKVIIDFCDDHFDWMHYQEAMRMADRVTCPTEKMAERIKLAPKWGPDTNPIVIPDPWEFPLERPHCRGWNTLWFGHAVNQHSLQRILPDLEGLPLRVVSNFTGTIPWSVETLLQELAIADIVVMPATEDYKGANRTVEAIRSGCFVIAEPHPAIMNIPGIYIGSIKEGLEWLKQQPLNKIFSRVISAQQYVTENYSPPIVASAWRTVIQSLTTSDAEKSTGPDGSTSIPEPMRT